MRDESQETSYRLYVIVNEKERSITFIEWSSKKEQERLIRKIKDQYRSFK